jgi:molecular chaperone GrpE
MSEPEPYIVRDKRRTGDEAQPPAEPAAAPPPAVAVSIPQLQEQLKRANDQYLRTLADVENTKKRLQRDKDDGVRYAVEAVMRELLPILDSLDQAVVAVDQHTETDALTKGVHLIYRQLLGLLEREGVKRIPTIGERFDPHVHEAVAQVPADAHHADGTVAEEVHVGYTLHGKVLRPAMVKVAQQPVENA